MELTLAEADAFLDREKFNRLYGGRSASAHPVSPLLYEQRDADGIVRAPCGAYVAFGLGDQEEYAIARRMPVCRRCLTALWIRIRSNHDQSSLQRQRVADQPVEPNATGDPVQADDQGGLPR